MKKLTSKTVTMRSTFKKSTNIETRTNARIKPNTKARQQHQQQMLQSPSHTITITSCKIYHNMEKRLPRQGRHMLVQLNTKKLLELLINSKNKLLENSKLVK